ncbi:Protein kinase [Entamoeba marina]
MLYKIIKDVYKEIRYLHMNKTKTHENIKLQNILIFNCDKNCNVSAKLTGFKSYVSIIRKGSKGMDYWNAFELVKGQNYSEKCDIYSFGMTLLNYLQPLTFKGVISNEEQEDGTYLKYTTNIQHNTRNLIINCCQIISSKRPDIIKCLKCIQEIRKCNREKSDSKKVEEINVRYSLPQFDILHSVKDVVKSIKKLKLKMNLSKHYLC